MASRILTEDVVSRILTEDVVSITQARDELQRLTTRRPDKATLARWIHRGVGGIRLEAVRIGSQLVTSRQALTRFITDRTTKSVGK